jgi:dTMP kinase
VTGRYVALEGVEGSGKSTVAALVASELGRRGLESVLVREPGGTPLGEEIRAMLLHAGGMNPWAEAALFAAQRAQLASQVIRPALERGAWVVSDRSYYSSLAYQGAARGLGIEAVRRLNETVLDGVEPDVVVVLDVDPAEGLARQLSADRIGGAGLAFQREVAEAYHLLAESEPDRVVLVSPDGPPDEVALRVMAVAEAVGV